VKAGITYREEQFSLEGGDILILMTDGIIEAHDDDGRMYGESGKLERAIAGFTPDMPAEAMVDAVIQSAIDYSSGDREDDMTVMVAGIR
jgi:serine phosphatase RsbU (regulator of sigma subunit)